MNYFLPPSQPLHSGQPLKENWALPLYVYCLFSLFLGVGVVITAFNAIVVSDTICPKQQAAAWIMVSTRTPAETHTTDINMASSSSTQYIH